MKLLNEAAVDDEFNRQMAKIQDAIEKLFALTKKFDNLGGTGIKPVTSQFSALQRASNDLDSIARVMFGQDRYKEMMW